jgi:hypothetical protein
MSINLIIGRASLVTNADGSKSVAFRPSFGKPGDKDGGVTGFRNQLKKVTNAAINGRFGLLRAKETISNLASDRQNSIRYKKFASAFKNQIQNLDGKQSPRFEALKAQAREDYRQNGETLLATAQAKLQTAQESLANAKDQNQAGAAALKMQKTALANAVATLKSLETARVGENSRFTELSALDAEKNTLKGEIAKLAKDVAHHTHSQKAYARIEARLTRDVKHAEQRVAYAEKQLTKINQATAIGIIVEDDSEIVEAPVLPVTSRVVADNTARVNDNLALVVSSATQQSDTTVSGDEAKKSS